MKPWSTRRAIVDAARSLAPLHEGQVITCPDFVAGRNENGNVVCGRYLFPGDDWDNPPDLLNKTRSIKLTEEERIKIAAKTGIRPNKHRDVLFYDAINMSRDKAEFVVMRTESAEWSAHPGHDFHTPPQSLLPDGTGAQFVTAKRLAANKDYSPSGDVIHFYWRKINTSCGYAHKDLEVVREMDKVFV